jgi:hypothetical protein
MQMFHKEVKLLVTIGCSLIISGVCLSAVGAVTNKFSWNCTGGEIRAYSEHSQPTGRKYSYAGYSGGSQVMTRTQLSDEIRARFFMICGAIEARETFEPKCTTNVRNYYKQRHFAGLDMKCTSSNKCTFKSGDLEITSNMTSFTTSACNEGLVDAFDCKMGAISCGHI